MELRWSGAMWRGGTGRVEDACIEEDEGDDARWQLMHLFLMMGHSCWKLHRISHIIVAVTLCCIDC